MVRIKQSKPKKVVDKRFASYASWRDKKGFIEEEAEVFFRLPPETPYLASMVRGRAKLHNEKRKKKWSDQKYRDEVIDLYRKNKWLKRTRTGKLVIQPYALLKDHEHRYKARHRDYRSPGEQRRRDFRSWQRRWERTRARYITPEDKKTKTTTAGRRK